MPMPLISTADIDFALQDFSGATSPNVHYGAQSSYGELKRTPVQVGDGNILQRIGTQITLLITDGALTGLVDDSTITVDGASFVIRDIGVALPDSSRLLTLEDA